MVIDIGDGQGSNLEKIEQDIKKKYSGERSWVCFITFSARRPEQLGETYLDRQSPASTPFPHSFPQRNPASGARLLPSS